MSDMKTKRKHRYGEEVATAGVRISRSVIRAGWNDQHLAEVLGCSRSSASDRMAGRTRWALADAIAIADALGVTVDDLLVNEAA